MANEDIQDASARLLATAALGGGVGAALYKGFKESPGSLQRVVEAVRGGTDTTVPRMMISTPVEDQARLLSEAFSAAQDIMSPDGTGELLRRAYERALYSAGVVADEDRGRIVGELVGSSKSWEMARGKIRDYEHQLGGMEGLYRSLRELTGGTIVGSRRKDVAQLVRELPEVAADLEGKLGGYLRSDFDPGGKFWEHRFGLPVRTVAEETPKGIADIGFSARANTELSRATGFKAETGIRKAERPRGFVAGQEGKFKFSALGGGKVTLPYREIGFRKHKGEPRKWFLQVPTAVEHRGINFVAADHRGMSFASVPHIAIPEGAGYKVVPWNEGINTMLYGDDKGIEGLATKLQKLHGDEKAMRDLTWEWNTRIRGLFHRVTGAQDNMTQAMMHSQSVVPLERIMAQVTGEAGQGSIEELTEFYTKLKKSGVDVGPLAGANPMAHQYRVSLRDWGKRWDVFGENYPMERRYGSRVRGFRMTEEAVEKMAEAPIAGVLPRGYGITTTAAARKEMEIMPQAAAYLTLGKARHFGEEEAIVSKKLAPMMTMKSTQKFEVLAGTTHLGRSEVLKQGAVIGVDYRTGQSILAKGVSGMVEQRIIDATQVGDIVKLEVETQLPLQDQMKIFGYKAQLRTARYDMLKYLTEEVGAGSAALRFSKDLDVIGHADLMKKIPQEVNKQMAEASWLIMQKRLQEAGAGGAAVRRQEAKRLTGEKTYTYKGGLPKNYVNMDMYMYVRDQSYRDKVLKNRQKAGARLAKRLGLQGEQEALGVGLEILRYARKHGLDNDELSLIGGAFYNQLEKSAGGAAEAGRLLGEVGLTEGQVLALRNAKGVLAMPTMHVGGYASFDHKMRRASMDYRALIELKAQRWGEAGEMLIGEIARRVIPAQDIFEMERAALSISGGVGQLPEGIERVTKIRDAMEAIGQREFLFDYGGKQIYVPGMQARGMGQFAAEPGDIRSQELRASYERYFRAQKAVRDFPGEASATRLEGAIGDLEKKVYKGWAAAQSLRGKVVGTAGSTAGRWLPGQPGQTTARMFGAVGGSYEEAVSQFVGADKRVFRTGITRETYRRMNRDLLSKATPEERLFLEAQEKAFLAGEKVTGFIWRHPTHRPQSLMPVWFELIEGKGESAQFPRVEMRYGDRVLDVSQAKGMNLDFDFDPIQTGLIADEKAKVAMDNLMNSRRYREQFIEGVAIKTDIQKRVKAAAAAGVLSKEVPDYVAGLQRLVGVKLETGTISNLVGDMRAAAAFQSSGEEFRIMSYLLAELEEAPISSKHGLHVGEVKGHMEAFVRGEGAGIRAGMREAWQKLFDEGTFTAGKIKYSADEFIDKMPQWISASEESGQLAAFRKIARYGAQAQKGKEMAEINAEQIARAITQAQGGMGDLNMALQREMRMGPGSGIVRSRAIAEGAREVAGTAFQAFKKHWKYPAIGGAIAFGISAVLGGGELEMKDHNQQVTALGEGPAVPHIAPPTMAPNRIVTAGGGSMPVGYGMHGTGDFNPRQIRQLGAFAGELGASVMMRDNRRAITPEYIEKISRERYH